MKKRIIAVDDDPVVVKMIQSSLEGIGFDVVTFTKAKIALEFFLENPAHLVISDLKMPEMSGNEFIDKIFENGYHPTILVLSGSTDTEIAVELLKQGVYDYMMKPFTSSELKSRVNRALEYAELKIIQENIKKEREARIENQLNWNLFRESIIKKDNSKIDSGLMANINTHLVQGAGLGALTAIGEMIRGDFKLEDNRYSIDKELIDMLLKNIEVSDRLISTIADIDYVINHNLPKKKISLNELHDQIKSVIAKNIDFQSINSHEVKLSENKFADRDGIVEINADYFAKVISELLVNAFKFSDPKSKIYILFEIVKENLQILILNSPQKDKKNSGGILPEYQNVIFEPFFRLSKFVFESYSTLDFGLGLCYAEKIIHNHNGKISISNLKNFLDETQPVLISVEIDLPLVN